MRVTRPASRSASRCRPLSLERLDDRIVPAQVDFFHGVLTYTAGAGETNDITIKCESQACSFQDPAAAIKLNFTNGTGSGTHSVRVGPIALREVRVVGGDRDDKFTVRGCANGIIVQVDGGDGGDQCF